MYFDTATISVRYGDSPSDTSDEGFEEKKRRTAYRVTDEEPESVSGTTSRSSVFPPDCVLI